MTTTLGGSFKIGGDLAVHRLGFGAMRLTGAGVWGPPKDVEGARRTLRKVSELGIDFIDTADSYGPEVSESMIGEIYPPAAHAPVIATKGGLARSGPNAWQPLGRPEYLRQCVLMSLRRLKRDRLDLWQLHRIDPKVPRDEQLEAIAEMQKEGLIGHVGLSEVSVDEVKAAGKFFKVATVQNLYNLVSRKSEPVLQHCERHRIGFIPWYPLAAGKLAAPGGPVDTLAKKLSATPSQVALAWMLKKSPVMLPIPGTSSAAHLEENAAGARLELSAEDFATLDSLGSKESRREAR